MTGLLPIMTISLALIGKTTTRIFGRSFHIIYRIALKVTPSPPASPERLAPVLRSSLLWRTQWRAGLCLPFGLLRRSSYGYEGSKGESKVEVQMEKR